MTRTNFIVGWLYTVVVICTYQLIANGFTRAALYFAAITAYFITLALHLEVDAWEE